MPKSRCQNDDGEMSMPNGRCKNVDMDKMSMPRCRYRRNVDLDKKIDGNMLMAKTSIDKMSMSMEKCYFGQNV